MAVKRYLKNTTDENIMLDLGFMISANSTRGFVAGSPEFFGLATSQQLLDLISAGTIVVNDGTSDLSPNIGIASLSYAMLYGGPNDSTVPFNPPDPPNTASLAIPVVTSAPTENLSAGQLCMDTDGIVYTYDPIRLKWLSIDRTRPVFSEDGLNVTGEWLRLGYAKHGKVGFKVKRNSTVVGVSAELADLQNRTATKGFTIRKLSDGINTDLYNFTTVDYTYMASDLDYDLSVGEIAQVWCVGAGSHCAFPTVILELAWRLD